MDVDAVVVADVYGYVGVEAVLFDEFFGKLVTEDEFVGGEVEDEYLGRACLLGFDGDVD